MALGAIELTFLLLLFATLGASFASRHHLPTEVVLLWGSLIIGLIPGLPRVTLIPEIVFSVFLPPILFAAAFFTDWREFRNNLRPISMLAVGLVVTTTILVAVVVRRLVPEIPWPVAFVLGAIVSPTDASAALSIIKKLGIPRRITTIIEGESLINDATALVCYRFAVAAILTGSFSLWDAFQRIVWVTLGGALTGSILCWVGTRVQLWLKEPEAETVFSFLTAYGCYIIAEHLGFSGVISTVIGGLVFGRWQPSKASTSTRVLSRVTWQIAIFIINGFIFTLIGLQLPSVVEGLRAEEYSNLKLAQIAILTSLTVFFIRLIWVFPEAYLPRWIHPALKKRDPTPHWKQLTLLGWTGMRGIVSLAAALALPQRLPSGEDFPYRNLLIFLSYCIILSALLLPALTLPPLIRWMKLEGDDPGTFREETLVRIALTERAIQRLRELEQEGEFSKLVLDQFLVRFERRLRSIRSHLEVEPFSELIQEDLEIRRMTRITLDTERAVLLELRSKGSIHSEVFHRLAQELDLEDLRLKTPRAI